MADARAYPEGIIPGYNVAAAEAMYAHGAAATANGQLPPGHVLIVYGANWCPHCQHSALNNGYAEKSGDTTILWLNAGDLTDPNYTILRRIAHFPGSVVSADRQSFSIGGVTVENKYPQVIEAIDGKVTSIIPTKGELPPKWFEAYTQAHRVLSTEGSSCLQKPIKISSDGHPEPSAPAHFCPSTLITSPQR